MSGVGRYGWRRAASMQLWRTHAYELSTPWNETPPDLVCSARKVRSRVLAPAARDGTHGVSGAGSD